MQNKTADSMYLKKLLSNYNLYEAEKEQNKKRFSEEFIQFTNTQLEKKVCKMREEELIALKKLKQAVADFNTFKNEAFASSPDSYCFKVKELDIYRTEVNLKKLRERIYAQEQVIQFRSQTLSVG